MNIDPTTASAAELDAADPLADFRRKFKIPDGVYLVGNSLGAMPKAARDYINTELDRWEEHGVEGHFTGDLAWKDYHLLVADQLSKIVGGLPSEVVAMNALTVNLHLMMVSFYDPNPQRHKILIEAHAFPSDHFAAESQIRQRGYDPATSLVAISPREGEETLRSQDILDAIALHGHELALVMLPGVQYYTGQVFPMQAIAAAAHQVGARVGFDLAHAVGNISLELHDWEVDFAVWCTYKYLNSGPGGVGGAFVHENHIANPDLPKLHGWWGTNPDTRFQMATDFDAIKTVDSWQTSNAAILSLATLRASLDIFEEAGYMGALRAKSELQIQYFDHRLAESLTGRISNATPAALQERGCQFALQVIGGHGREVFEKLEAARIMCDWREPDVIRVAPVPLYNSFADIDEFVWALDRIMS